MAGYVLFISEDKLKDSTAINMNVDVNFLLPYVKIAQKKYVETKCEECKVPTSEREMFIKMIKDYGDEQFYNGWNHFVTLSPFLIKKYSSKKPMICIFIILFTLYR